MKHPVLDHMITLIKPDGRAIFTMHGKTSGIEPVYKKEYIRRIIHERITKDVEANISRIVRETTNS